MTITRRTRRFAGLAASAIAAVTLSGCGDSTSADAAAAREIAERVEQAPDALRVDATYSTGPNDPGILSYRVLVRPDITDERRKALADAVEKEVWASTIAPINSFTVIVTTEAWKPGGERRMFSDPGELTLSYAGPRSVESGFSTRGPRPAASAR